MTNSPWAMNAWAMNGQKYSDLEFEDKAFIRSVIRAQLARVVDGIVQIRQASDADYTVPFATAMMMAPKVVKEWWFDRRVTSRER